MFNDFKKEKHISTAHFVLYHYALPSAESKQGKLLVYQINCSVHKLLFHWPFRDYQNTSGALLVASGQSGAYPNLHETRKYMQIRFMILE